MSGHALGTGAFTFKDVRVADDTMLLPPGAAFRAAMTGIDLARVNVAASCCGMMAAALEIAIAATGKRSFGGRPVAEQQGLQWILADVATDLEAARALTAKATAALDAGDQTLPLAAHAKKFATRVALTGLAQCMQAMGAPGYRQDHPVARHFAAAKMAQYLDGTSEIQNVVISRALFGTR